MISTRLFVLCLVASIPAAVLAEQPGPIFVLPSEMVSLLAGDEDQRREAANRFLESEAKLQSWNRDHSFQYEIVSQVPAIGEQDNFERSLIDSRNGEPRAIFIPGKGLLATLLSDKGRLYLSGDGKWRVSPPEPWGIWINRERYIPFPDVAPIPPGEMAAVEFFPGGFVKGYLRDKSLPPVWLPEIQAFGFDHTANSRIRVQLRGPNDTLRYGSELSRIEMTMITRIEETGKQKPGFWEMKSIQIGETVTRMRDISHEELVEKHATDLREPARGTPVNGPLAMAGSVAMWETLAGSPRLNRSVDIQQLAQVSNPGGNASELSALTLTALALVNLASNKNPIIEERLVHSRQMFETAIAQIEHEAQAEMGDSSWVDDPSMKWRHFEKRIGPSRQMGMFLSLLAIYNLANNTESERFQLLSLLGRLGLPSGLGNPYLAIESTVPNPLHRDILLSLWQLEPAEGGRERMVVRLAEARDEPEVRYALVTALLATGRIEEVSREDLLEWIDRGIFSDDRRQQVIGTFHITRHPSGSKFLLDQKEAWLAGKDDPSGCLAALQARAEATLELERFDFLTREQCRQILELGETDRK